MAPTLLLTADPVAVVAAAAAFVVAAAEWLQKVPQVECQRKCLFASRDLAVLESCTAGCPQT